MKRKVVDENYLYRIVLKMYEEIGLNQRMSTYIGTKSYDTVIKKYICLMGIVVKRNM